MQHNRFWIGMVGVIFVAAKVFDFGSVSTWDWWLVLLPFYLELSVVSTIWLLLMASAVIMTIIFLFKFNSSEENHN